MTNITPFDFNGIQVRAIQDERGEPWFIAADVARALKYANPAKAVRDHCKHAKLFRQNESVCLDEINPRGMTIIPEGDVYRLVMRSNLPEAERFERWVMEEVIPAIRRHGMYATPSTVEAMLSDPDTMIRTLQALKAERERRAALEAQAERDRPKAIFADSVAASSTSILVGDFSKILRQNGHDVGQKRLFEWLRENGYLMRTPGSWNMPTQRAMELGLFEVKESTVNNPDGSIRITKTTKITGKGQIYFVNKFHARSSGRAA